MDNQVKFTNIDDEERLQKIYYIAMELFARETSGNYVVQDLTDKTWIELCDEGVRLFQELKNEVV